MIPCAHCGDAVEMNPGWEEGEDKDMTAPWWHVVIGTGEDTSDHEAVPDPEFITSILRHPSTRPKLRLILEIDDVR